MARISIHNFGPIRDCNIEVEKITVLTGEQATGKSTVAKCVFFCRTIKDDIYDVILKRNLLGNNNTLFNDVIRVLRNKFLQIFGTSMAMDRALKLIYFYGTKTFVQVSLKLQEGYDYISPNYVWIDFSDDILNYLRSPHESHVDKDKLKQEINDLFHDEYETIFIPAGRGLITLLTSQLNYLFTTMDDEQKRSIDFCTQKYIERILKIRASFDNGIEGLISQRKNMPMANLDHITIHKMLELVNEVLKGRYIFKDSEERLYIDKEKYIKINFTSSGQQETVWIFNILLHLLINSVKSFIILEEPEAHLYPEAQKHMVEILSLLGNRACGLLVTTHSPYILGALNNHLYAAELSERTNRHKQVNDVVEKIFQINVLNAYFLEKGELRSCMEEGESKLIINEVIDGASTEINEVYDKLFNIEFQED